MKVSVIVATYKGHYLAETLESVRRQTHDHLEVLVLDDADEESCRRLVESLDDDRFRYVGNGNPLRPARNHRLGIALSTGDAIAILNHDDFFADDTVELLVAALDEHRRLSPLAGSCGDSQRQRRPGSDREPLKTLGTCGYGARSHRLLALGDGDDHRRADGACHPDPVDRAQSHRLAGESQRHVRLLAGLPPGNAGKCGAR